MTTSYRQPILKVQYRSSLGIMHDILHACMDGGLEGVLISEISRKANLSHLAALQNLQRLVHAGLARSIRTERNSIFVITEKGIKFYREFQKFQAIAQELKIRY
ncbi:MAG: transcriptional regulator [Thaumarchaeota archaeon]|nr:transcriptional regulator [Nitrososphaerota archaeon]